MIGEIGNFKLKNGEEILVKKFFPPAEEFKARLLKFFPYTASVWDEEKRRRVEGDLLGLSKDYFFMGEIAGELVGNIWYTTPFDMEEVATLGFVYIKLEHRRKGIAIVLMEQVLKDFLAKSKGFSCIYLNTSMDNPVHEIYARFGFKDYNYQGTNTVMRLAIPTEQNFDSEYFFWKGKAEGRETHRGDLPKLEALFNRPGWIVKDFVRRVIGTTPYEGQFVEMMNAVDKGYSYSLVLENPKGIIVGWASVTFRQMSYQVDFLVCPEYEKQTFELVEEVIEKGKATNLHSCAAPEDVAKIRILDLLGFKSERIIDIKIGTQDFPILFFSKSNHKISPL